MNKDNMRLQFDWGMSWLICLLALLIGNKATAQVVSTDALSKITNTADAFQSNRPIEKLYFQFDKPYYAINDTIWFKAYLFNAAYLTPSAKSGILYIELANDSNKLIKRMMFPVATGVSWGDIPLDAKEIPAGSYVLRAYTNWMRNFSEDYIFKRNFYFGVTDENNWLANTRINLFKGEGVDTARLTLQLNKLDKEPVLLKDMNLAIMDDKKLWYKSKVHTDLGGTINVNFALKSPAKHLTLLLNDGSGDDAGHKLKIPVVLSRPEDIDLQFMPEGGNLVAGLPTTVGFKAIGPDGKAVALEGNILDSRQQIIAAFKSAYSGIGRFELSPQVGETYTAKVFLPGGAVKTFRLPTVKSSGTVLKVRTVNGSDSLAITITATKADSSYYLVAQSRGIFGYAAVINLVNNSIKVRLPSAIFPTGITHFTLLNAAKQPLNERMIFIDHHDNLRISAQTGKSFYTKRDSVPLTIHVSAKNGSPVKGSFSLSVTDDSQVKTDSLHDHNMVSDLLLTTDLKGYVEEPGYYLQPDHDESIKQHLDNLLLTQGWVGYDWKYTDPPNALLYDAEPAFIIKGKVANGFNKPLANIHVTLLSKRPFVALDTVTDKYGRFIFKDVVPLDTPVFFVQARNKRGNSFNIGVDVDEFKPTAFTKPTADAIPWYIDNDPALINFIKTGIAAKADQEKRIGGGRRLKEVVISSKKIIKGSQNLNGSGNADIVIDEKELEKAGKKTFLELLQERVKGFKTGVFIVGGPKHERPDQKRVLSNPANTRKRERDREFYKFVTDEPEFVPEEFEDQRPFTAQWYFIDNKPVKFIIDGIAVNQVIPATIPPFNSISDYLTSHSAEDIKGIEVMHSTKYASTYVPMRYVEVIHPSDIAYIEITTRSGNGPGIHNTPGTYLYKPLPFSLPRQFYTPKYTVINKNHPAKDLRSTIFWKPDLVTDKDGNASVSFYSADKTGSYTIISEGTDLDGHIGSFRSKIHIR